METALNSRLCVSQKRMRSPAGKSAWRLHCLSLFSSAFPSCLFTLDFSLAFFSLARIRRPPTREAPSTQWSRVLFKMPRNRRALNVHSQTVVCLCPCPACQNQLSAHSTVLSAQRVLLTFPNAAPGDEPHQLKLVSVVGSARKAEETTKLQRLAYMRPPGALSQQHNEW